LSTAYPPPSLEVTKWPSGFAFFHRVNRLRSWSSKVGWRSYKRFRYLQMTSFHGLVLAACLHSFAGTAHRSLLNSSAKKLRASACLFRPAGSSSHSSRLCVSTYVLPHSCRHAYRHVWTCASLLQTCQTLAQKDSAKKEAHLWAFTPPAVPHAKLGHATANSARVTNLHTMSGLSSVLV
jgi:hypothetical protein